MEVTFRKADGPRDHAPWIARRNKSRIVGSRLGGDPRSLPHDVVTLLVERELGIHDGFFATVAEGGTFRSMRKRRTTYGKSAIARNRPGLDRAEHQVHREWSAWKAGLPTPCSAVLTSAEEEWKALPPGGEMTLTWPTVAARAARRRSRR